MMHRTCYTCVVRASFAFARYAFNKREHGAEARERVPRVARVRLIQSHRALIQFLSARYRYTYGAFTPLAARLSVRRAVTTLNHS